MSRGLTGIPAPTDAPAATTTSPARIGPALVRTARTVPWASSKPVTSARRIARRRDLDAHGTPHRR